jgi:hypothetical protein
MPSFVYLQVMSFGRPRTVIIVFLAIREATRNFYPGLLGLVYAVLPCRSSGAFYEDAPISNLLCALVIWLSLTFWGARSGGYLAVGFMSVWLPRLNS